MTTRFIIPKRLRVLLVSLTLIATLGSLVVLWFRPDSQSDVQKVKELLGRHYVLPSDEEPALLTVVDSNSLSSSYLKQHAKNGDRVLVYQKHQRVIIYRPSIDRIVDVGPVVLEAPISNAH